MKRFIRLFFVTLCFMCQLLIPTYAEAKVVKKILMLSAYHSSFDNAFKQIDGVRSVLPFDEYNLDVEFMDSKRFEDEKTQSAFAINLKSRLDKLPKYDLIIAAEDNALNFAVSHRDWFNDIPIVFLGINDIERGKKLAEDPMITGVLQSLSMADTIALAKELFPNIKSVTAISDGASTGKVLAEEFRVIGKEFKDLKTDVLSSANMSWEEFWRKVPEYGADNAFLFLAIYLDKDQNTLDFKDGMARLVGVSKSPIFCVSDNCINTGAIGGKVLSHYEHGREAALIAKHYFETKSLDPIVKASPNKIVLDYNVIKKLGINEKVIPKDAIIENIPVSFVKKYMKWIVLTLLVGLLQTGLILALLINRRQRNKALQASWKSEENLRITLESIGDGVIATDIDGNVTKINKVAEELTGWKREEAVGSSFEEVFNIISSVSGNRISSPVKKIIEQKSVIGLEADTILISKAGDLRHVADSGAPIFNDMGDLVGVVLVFRDVTEQEKLEKVARENDERMRMFFSSSSYGIYCVEFDKPILIKDVAKGDAVKSIKETGRMLFANKRAANIIGFHHEEEIMHKTLREIGFSAEASERQKLLLESFSKSNFGMCNVETTATSIDGVQRNINYKITGIAEDNYLVRIWVVMEDITELKKAEDQFHQAQKMDVIGRLAGGVAHDFNNMLGGILGHAELIEMNIDETSPIKRHIGPIISAATRAADLTNKLLVFSRKGKTVFVRVDMHEIVGSSLSLLERSFDKNITIETTLNAPRHMVLGDSTLLQNALMNLAINARDSMPTGGKISFETANITLSSDIEEITYNLPKGEYIEVSVSDTGSGISKDVLSRIFEPFFTTKPVGKGTGLGLAAVYGTIKEHKGSINVYSEVGYGTMFKIYLPVDIEYATEDLIDNVDPTLIYGEGLILIVDDEDLIRNMAGDILSALGYKVLLAEDSDKALELFKKQADKIDLVILDMVMPKRSGKELYEMLREVNPDVKVIISSGFSRKDNIDEMIKDGVKAFIQKPYRKALLSQMIAKVLAGEKR